MQLNFKTVISIILLALGTITIISKINHKKETKAFFSEVDEYYYGGNYQKCIELLEDYTLKNIKQTSGWNYLGMVYLKRGDDSLAELAFKNANDIRPNLKALAYLGTISVNKGSYLEGKKYWEEVIEIDPQFAKAYSSLSVIEIKNKNYLNAVSLAEKGSELDSTDLGIKGNLMVAYHLIGEIKKRDLLLTELEVKNYKYLKNLKLLVAGNIQVDDLIF